MADIWYIYRTNGGYVESASVSDPGTMTAPFDKVQAAAQDLAPQKVWDGGSVRNATAQELTDQSTKKDEDDKASAKTAIKALLQQNDAIAIGILGLAKATASRLGVAWNTFKSEVLTEIDNL